MKQLDFTTGMTLIYGLTLVVLCKYYAEFLLCLLIAIVSLAETLDQF